METKLGISFLALIVILLGTAYLTASRMQHMHAKMEETLSKGLIELQLAQDGLRYSSENSRITMQLFLVQQQEEIDQLLKRRKENYRKISAVLVALEPYCESQEEKQLLETVKETRTDYVNSYGQALHLLLTEKKTAAATELIVQQTTPALFRYHTLPGRTSCGSRANRSGWPVNTATSNTRPPVALC
ncbi:MAG: MCP four helix bundle domain-containing protein [Candidatus Korobacteraceae bacterium]